MEIEGRLYCVKERRKDGGKDGRNRGKGGGLDREEGRIGSEEE